MSSRIRCAKCGHEMWVPESRSGTNMNCPECNALFTVPMILNVARETVDVSIICFACNHENAPGTTICRRCGADLVAKVKAPFSRRLSLWLERQWPFALAGSMIALVLIYVGVRIYSVMPASEPTQTPVDPNQVVEVTPLGESLVDGLFVANTQAERDAAFQTLLNQGPSVQEHLVARLAEYAESEASSGREDAATELAIELMVILDQPDESVLAVLKHFSDSEAVRASALLARGSFGDLSAAPMIRNWWLRLLERELFLTATVEQDELSTEELVEVLDFTRDQRRQVTQALRRLVQEDLLGVLEPLAERYWRSWRWLGQKRGEVFADALFELAMPYRGRLTVLSADEEEAKEAIRAARSTLSILGEQGGALAASAAGVAMARNTPQYESARDRIVTALLGKMNDLRASDQQRVIWAMARLTGRLFGSYGSSMTPWEVTPEVGREVVVWASKEHGIEIQLAENSRWMRPVELEYKVALASVDPNENE